ncbi:MAG: hypothetical protein ABIB93_00055 [Chloroflexota bacterium]
MRKNLFLYLALACFAAILAILVSRGYLGVFDTVQITTRGNQTALKPDETGLRFPQSTIYATWGEKISFVYELENRQFSPYETRIEATLKDESQHDPLVLFSQDKKMAPFQKLEMVWSISPEVLETRGFREGQYTIEVKRAGVVQKTILVYYSPEPKPPYYVPVPVPR